MFVGGAVTFVKKAATFIGEGSLAIGRLFKTAMTFIGRGSLAVEGRGKASGACTGGACIGRAFIDGAAC